MDANNTGNRTGQNDASAPDDLPEDLINTPPRRAIDKELPWVLRPGTPRGMKDAFSESASFEIVLITTQIRHLLNHITSVTRYRSAFDTREGVISFIRKELNNYENEKNLSRITRIAQVPKLDRPNMRRVERELYGSDTEDLEIPHIRSNLRRIKRRRHGLTTHVTETTETTEIYEGEQLTLEASQLQPFSGMNQNDLLACASQLERYLITEGIANNKAKTMVRYVFTTVMGVNTIKKLKSLIHSYSQLCSSGPDFKDIESFKKENQMLKKHRRLKQPPPEILIEAVDNLFKSYDSDHSSPVRNLKIAVYKCNAIKGYAELQEVAGRASDDKDKKVLSRYLARRGYRTHLGGGQGRSLRSDVADYFAKIVSKHSGNGRKFQNWKADVQYLGAFCSELGNTGILALTANASPFYTFRHKFGSLENIRVLARALEGHIPGFVECLKNLEERIIKPILGNAEINKNLILFHDDEGYSLDKLVEEDKSTDDERTG